MDNELLCQSCAYQLYIEAAAANVGTKQLRQAEQPSVSDEIIVLWSEHYAEEAFLEDKRHYATQQRHDNNLDDCGAQHIEVFPERHRFVVGIITHPWHRPSSCPSCLSCHCRHPSRSCHP